MKLRQIFGIKLNRQLILFQTHRLVAGTQASEPNMIKPDPDLLEGWSPQILVLTAEALSGDLYNCQFWVLRSLVLPCSLTIRKFERGDFLIVTEVDDIVHKTCVQYISKTDYHTPSMTPNRLYASPASNFQPTRWFPDHKNPDPWNPTNETHSLTSKTPQTPSEMTENWRRSLDG